MVAAHSFNPIYQNASYDLVFQHLYRTCTLSLDNVGRAHNTRQTVLQTMFPTWLPTYSPPYMLSYPLSYRLSYLLAYLHASCDGFEHASFVPWPTSWPTP